MSNKHKQLDFDQKITALLPHGITHSMMMMTMMIGIA